MQANHLFCIVSVSAVGRVFRRGWYTGPMKQTRSHCPVNVALEAVGDAWSLLIVRDITFNGKHGFNELLASDERIASNILADRLRHLQAEGIITVRPDARDGRKRYYTVTDKGLDLTPVICALAEWGARHDPLTAVDPDFLAYYQANPTRALRQIRRVVAAGGAVLVGPDSLLAQIKHTS